MTKETLVFALEAERLKAGNNGIVIPEERDVTFMVAGPGETLQVGKIVKIELRDSVLCMETAKGERYWFTYDLVLGMHLKTAQTSVEHTTGFGR
jgi:hypothetical protein